MAMGRPPKEITEKTNKFENELSNLIKEVVDVSLKGGLDKELKEKVKKYVEHVLKGIGHNKDESFVEDCVNMILLLDAYRVKLLVEKI